MENNSLESLPPPLTTTPAIPTSTTATPTSTTPTAATRSSTAEHSAATNTTTIEYTPAAQHQSDQPATGQSSNKRRHDPPYDWQLLPQEERDLIAYNSRRQKKARLRDNPPRCRHCPEAKFTSLAMLSTHYLSKRHLARVRRKEQSHNREQEQDLDLDQDQEQAPNTDTKERVTQLEPTSPTQEVLHNSATDNGSSHDVIKEYTTPTSENNSTPQDQPAARPSKNASQRKRKQERDRKKARARLEKRSKSGHSIMGQSVKGHVETKEEREDEATVSTSNGLLEDAQHHSPMDDDELLRAQCDINAQLAHTSSSSPPVAGSDIAASSTEVHPSTSNAALPQPHQQQHWHCSICGSSWRKEKAWRGHLLSAQHLRHTLATMQQIAPDIRPYGRVDVMASMDPFGWGTGAGVVEEEEEDSDEGDGGDDNDSNVEGKAVVGNDDDDDMDMSD